MEPSSSEFQALSLLRFSFLVSFVLQSCHSISFRKTRFNPEDTTIIYDGGAAPYVGAIEFNSHTYDCQVGRVTYFEKVPIWDSETQKLTDFATHYSFFIDVQGRTSYAAGLSFFLAPAKFDIPPNSSGGFLGLYNITTASSAAVSNQTTQIVHVEFDSYPDPKWDPPLQHVGINNNSLSSTISTAWNASLHSGDNADVWINYNSSNFNLSVVWKYQSTASSQENNSLSTIIDLREALPELVTIGFSASTSVVRERHSLSSWEFTSSLEKAKPRGNSSESRKLLVILPLSAAAFMAVIIGIAWRVKQAETNSTSIDDELEKGTGPRRFSYSDLISGTHNFSNDRKLGEGGCGAVYRGYLSDLDMIVAIKKIPKGSKLGKRALVTEAKIITQLRHKNLVQLIGWCHEKGDFLLVYEFMPNGSLDSHLFGKRVPLIWTVRYKIVLGLVSALLYLHEEWEQCVIHRDIKPSNIMLDSSFNVKLGDFGLARLIDHELGPETTGLAGTLGYLAPEYVNTGRASKESDVYSFGVVVLEIVSGKRAVEPAIVERSEMGLVEWVWDVYGDGNLKMAIDERLGVDFDEKEAECLLIVGLWCAHPDSNLRPSIRQAIQVLNFEAELPKLATKIPVSLHHVYAPSASSPEPLMSSLSINSGKDV